MPAQPDRSVVFILSALLLALSLLLYKLGGYLTDSPARLLDLNWLTVTDAGFLPYRDFWVERPPLLAAWSWLAYRASLLLPPWLDWRLFFALFDGLAGLAGSITALALASRLLSPVRLAAFGASLAFAAFTIASDAGILLALTLGWLTLEQANRWRSAAAIAALSPFLAGPLPLVAHLGWGLVVRRRVSAMVALVPIGGALAAAWLAGGQLRASAQAMVATGGASVFTATERRLDAGLAPAPGVDWLLPLGLTALAAVVAWRTRRSIVASSALLVAGAGLAGPLAGPATLLLLSLLPILALPLLGATVLSAAVGVVATSWLAAGVDDRALAALGVVAGAAAAIGVAWRTEGPADDSREFAAQLVAFVALRLGALLLFRPFGYFGEWNDFNFFLIWARLADEGLLPFRDFWMEHPPIFPSLVVMAYRIATALPPMADEHFWFNLTLGLLTLPAELAALVAIRRIAGIVGPPATPATAGWAYVLSFPALFFWTAGFDGLVLAFTLLGIAAALAGWTGRAGLWIGLGTMTKIVPAAVLPALLYQAGRRGAARLASIFLAVVAIVLVPVVAVNPRLAAASAASLTTRGSWETIWALVDGYYRGGELVPPRDRGDPSSVQATARPSAVPWLPIAAAGGAGYLVLLWQSRRPLSARRTLAWAAAGLVGLLAISKGWSPQFVVYPLGLLFPLLPSRRALLYAVNLIAANAFEYPFALLLLDSQPIPLGFAIVWRTGLLAALVFEFVAIGLQLPPRPALAAATAAALRWLPLAFVPLAVWALIFYRAIWLEPDDPLRSVLAEAARLGGVLAAADDELRQLAPYAGVPVLRPIAGRLAPAALAERDAWLVPPREPAAQAELAVELARYGLVVNPRDPARSAIFVPIDRPWQSLNVRLGEHTLHGYSLEQLDLPSGSASGGIVVSTRWTLGPSKPTDLRMFAHLVSSDGQILAQNDGPLLASGADPETIDRRLVPAAPGGRRIVVGLYDGSTGVRLVGPDGRDSVTLPIP